MLIGLKFGRRTGSPAPCCPPTGPGAGHSSGEAGHSSREADQPCWTEEPYDENKICCRYVQGFKESQICHKPGHNILLSDTGKNALKNCTRNQLSKFWVHEDWLWVTARSSKKLPLQPEISGGLPMPGPNRELLRDPLHLSYLGLAGAC
jgi:hypothetical protein